ncbi:MAG: rhodanese-like domain-containing protein [Burkholderiales bacterium]|nr:rhodanese-like domain-containing protein [Burkholderiales bacterium]OUT77673.1 MAG: hypothetical protein CBB82_05855 [Betaproteobacteria bacterium TMED22]|tara:strand:- start:10644 stop:11048 length:405 start_codon:yes stop_codon:yes gene_type:complete
MRLIIFKAAQILICGFFLVNNVYAGDIDLSKRHSLKPEETIHLDPNNILFIDVRTQKEWNNGYISGATHLPLKDFKANLANIVPDKKTPVLVYCSKGGRAIAASKYMNNLGYHGVPVINGGYMQMLSAGHKQSR